MAGKTLTDNPKLAPSAASNTEKDPDDWVSGDDAMTGAQASYLKTLSEQAHDPEAFDDTLTKAEASKRIDALKAHLTQGNDKRAQQTGGPESRGVLPETD
jgi:Protein of unknown function (DUF3072)